MARAYSLDLRERVVAAVAAGQSCRSVAKTLMVSVASVVKWSQRQRVVGSPAALRMGGRRPYLVARERDWVLSRIAEKPDLTLASSTQGTGRARPGGELLCALAFSPA
jgi:transposase